MTWLRNEIVERALLVGAAEVAACAATGRMADSPREGACACSSAVRATTNATPATAGPITPPSFFILHSSLSLLEQFFNGLDAAIDHGHRPPLWARQLLVDLDAEAVQNRRSH